MTFNFILFVLTTWRITNLLVNEDGPFSLLQNVRCWVGKYTEALECAWCTSVWTGLLVSLFSTSLFGYSVLLVIPYALAYSAMSIFITVILERVQAEECEAITEHSSL